MITQTANTASRIASDVAGIAASAVAPGSVLNVGEPVTQPVDLALSYAVMCELGGTVTGELAFFVEEAFGRSMVEADGAELDLADALAPTMATLAGALGSVVLGPARTIDARMAESRINASEEMAIVGLDDGQAIRAAIAVGVASAAPVAAAPAVRTAGAGERLDLLRGVEMSATVELGRARMTVNDLLSLHDGAIIELDRAAGAAADLLVNGRLIAHGEIVVMDENYALRITQIVTDEPSR
ncbi:flagellar motor switch protein FliN [Jatrophihabitans fulvus]